MSQVEKYSRLLSKLLRHQAISRKLDIGDDGFVPLAQIMLLPEFSGCSFSTIQTVVNDNNKKRFELVFTGDITDSVDNHENYKIRAVQGHTIAKIQDDLLLEPITDPSLYPTIIHGTYRQCINSILATGLSKMQRNHIHFAINYPEGSEVISGMRKSAEVAIVVDLEKALADGIPFFISKNKVVLSKGVDDSGILPVKYFKQIVIRDGKPFDCTISYIEIINL